MMKQAPTCNTSRNASVSKPVPNHANENIFHQVQGQQSVLEFRNDSQEKDFGLYFPCYVPVMSNQKVSTYGEFLTFLVTKSEEFGCRAPKSPESLQALELTPETLYRMVYNMVGKAALNFENAKNLKDAEPLAASLVEYVKKFADFDEPEVDPERFKVAYELSARMSFRRTEDDLSKFDESSVERKASKTSLKILKNVDHLPRMVAYIFGSTSARQMGRIVGTRLAQSLEQSVQPS